LERGEKYPLTLKICLPPPIVFFPSFPRRVAKQRSEAIPPWRERVDPAKAGALTQDKGRFAEE